MPPITPTNKDNRATRDIIEILADCLDGVETIEGDYLQFEPDFSNVDQAVFSYNDIYVSVTAQKFEPEVLI